MIRQLSYTGNESSVNFLSLKSIFTQTLQKEARRTPGVRGHTEAKASRGDSRRVEHPGEPGAVQAAEDPGGTGTGGSGQP